MADTSALVVNRRRDKKSYPFLIQKAELRSFHAQQTYDRAYGRCAEAIFTISIVVRALASDEEARQIESVVEADIEKSAARLKTQQDQLDKMAEANGIIFDGSGVAYSTPITVEARIDSPHALQYLTLIRDLDATVAKFDVLWLARIIQGGDYANAIYALKRDLLRLAGRVENLANRAVNAANSAQKQKAVDEAEKAMTNAATGNAATASDSASEIVDSSEVGAGTTVKPRGSKKATPAAAAAEPATDAAIAAEPVEAVG